MRLTQKQLRRLVTELFNGSSMGSHLKQGIEKLWEADNLFQKALSEAPDDATHAVITQVHKAVESLAFKVDGKMQGLVK